MYSVKPQVLELTALLVAFGISHAVVSPGSRNAPLAHSLASCPAISCVPVVDERSAAFTAIGMSQALHRPVAVCCTSGSALLDMAPAVAEAFYQNIPLLILSADRPAAWIGQMDAQTIVQPGAFHNFIRKEVTLPEPVNAESLWHCNRLINEALLELTAGSCGPVHINIPISEPLFAMSTPELPKVRRISREQTSILKLSREMQTEWQQSRRPLIIVGQTLPGHDLVEPLRALMHSGCLVLAEHLANLTELQGEKFFIDRVETMLAKKDTPLPAPDFVLTLSGHVVSKRLKLFLRKAAPFTHWHVSPEGSCPDLFQNLTRAVAAQPSELVQALNSPPRNKNDASYLAAWGDCCQAVHSSLLAYTPNDFSDVAITQRVLAALPSDCNLQLGNSSAVRNAQLFDLPVGTRIFCNRGVNGIDGSLSTATGCAIADDHPTFVLIGDLSFFYDQNALWKESLPGTLRILLFNNGGGGIFHMLPGLNSPHRDRFIAGSSNLTAEHVAETYAIEYHKARNFSELAKLLPTFCAAPRRNTEAYTRPQLLEIFSDISTCAKAIRQLERQACATAKSTDRIPSPPAKNFKKPSSLPDAKPSAFGGQNA